MRIQEPYHEGERLVQRITGEQDLARRNGAVISNAILPGALKFLDRQSMVVLGSVDADGRPTASLLFGQPGFMTARDAQTVELHLSLATIDKQDLFWANIEKDARVGILAIELGSRRRLRINGRIERSPGGLTVHVEESFPNCPKYIQRRHLQLRTNESGQKFETRIKGEVLGSEQENLVRNTDTLFVASANPAGGIDASHRGGQPGFVEVVASNRLRIPDYPGNSLFNTLGNLSLNPQVSLVSVDFEGGRLIQLWGLAEISFSGGGLEQTGGTGRYWDLSLKRFEVARLPVAAHWEFLDSASQNPVVGVPIAQAKRE